MADMRRLRSLSGLTQAEFSRRFGMSTKSYQFLESGPDIALMHRQVLALEVLSLDLSLEKQDPSLLLPTMLRRIRRFNHIEKVGLIL